MSQPGIPRTIAVQITLLSAWIVAQMAYRSQPGLSVGIVYGEELVWTEGFGYADIAQQRPATPHTLYRIASITKLFTSVAVLQLRDAGKLRLDEPLTTYLPWFTPVQMPDAPPITLRHILTHTAGLPREAPFPYWTDNQFPDHNRFQRSVAQQQPTYAPELRWKYSNLAMALAGAVVATVADEPYTDYIVRHILAPLEMRDTLVTAPASDHPQLAKGYGRRLPDGSRSTSPWTDTQGLTAAAGMSSSVADLARFAVFLLGSPTTGGPAILRQNTVREMQRVHWLEPDWQAGWGLGLRITRTRDRTYVGHGGALLGYRTQLQLWPDAQLGVIVLTNADDGNPALYTDQALLWVGTALQAERPTTSPRIPDPTWEQYIGLYRNAWRDSQVLVLDGQLVLLDPSEPDPLATKYMLTPVGSNTFRCATANGFGIDGELVTFELDAAGQVQRVKIGENYSAPVKVW